MDMTTYLNWQSSMVECECQLHDYRLFTKCIKRTRSSASRRPRTTIHQHRAHTTKKNMVTINTYWSCARSCDTVAWYLDVKLSLCLAISYHFMSLCVSHLRFLPFVGWSCCISIVCPSIACLSFSSSSDKLEHEKTRTQRITYMQMEDASATHIHEYVHIH